MTTTFKPKTSVDAGRSLQKLFMFGGVAMLILGLLAVGSAFTATLLTVVILGGFLAAAGVVEMVQSFWAGKVGYGIAEFLLGLVYLVGGVFTMLNPVVGAMSITLIVAATLIVLGIVRIVNGISDRKISNYWGWTLAGGILDVVLGGLLSAGWPSTALWALGLFVGIDLLFHGLALLNMSSLLRKTFRMPTTP